MEVLYGFILIGIVALLMSLFSSKQGSSNLILSIIAILGMIIAIYNNPNVETLMMIVFVVSLFFFVTNRYWRSAEGFQFAEVDAKVQEARRQIR